MISKLVISQAAIYDIEQAIDWYNRQRKGLGDELEISLEVGLASLQKDPLVYQEKYRNVRVKYLKRFPYGIHFQIQASNIKVIALFHVKRNPVNWTNRLL